MRQFPISSNALACNSRDQIAGSITRFQCANKALSQALGLETCLKPEVSIILELYEAARSGEIMTVTMLGLLDDIAPTTSLRYLSLLEELGAVERFAHETDKRSTCVEISSAAKTALDTAFLTAEPIEVVV